MVPLWRVDTRDISVAGSSDDSSASKFGVRLAFAFALALFLVGAMGYALLTARFEERLVHAYATEQKAEAASFEEVDARTEDRKEMLREITEIMRSRATRPGTKEVLLIDSSRIVRASGDESVVGERDTDARIEAALDHGTPYEGREADKSRDSSNFEFVVPLELDGQQFVYAISRDSRFLDAQLRDLRETLALIGGLALLLGGGTFYLVGGRPLMRSHRQVLQRATRDGLTDLPNQRAFQDDFRHVVSSAHRLEEPLALAVLDIDDFKFLNDRHGHPHGDGVIRQVASVLRDGRTADRAFRVGGDEFALLMQRTDAAGARELTRRLSRAFADERVSVSIGVSELRPGQDAASLRGEADAALYEAKRHGGNRAVHYGDVRDDVVLTTSDKMLAVRNLLEQQKLDTVFQPIWDLTEGTLVGVEALSRPDPSYGFTGPSEAFDVAERVGRVHELDQLCIAKALSVAPRLPDGVLLFLNVSPSTLDLDADEDSWLQQAIEAAGLAPERVVVEVTERFGGRTTSVIKSLLGLREAGFKLALDDVGTGNAGLEMLRRVDAEFVKIDRGIVAAAPTEPAARAVLMAMATFAHQTGAFVIAEGIEDADTLDFVRSVDDSDLAPASLIQGGQGFGLGRPAYALPSAGAKVVRPGVSPLPTHAAASQVAPPVHR
jgi:diguanylate cyclase (GGDEF)-like protein